MKEFIKKIVAKLNWKKLIWSAWQYMSALLEKVVAKTEIETDDAALKDLNKLMEKKFGQAEEVKEEVEEVK